MIGLQYDFVSKLQDLVYDKGFGNVCSQVW